MKWAVAFVWEDFPKYDEVKTETEDGVTFVRYYYKKKLVYEYAPRFMHPIPPTDILFGEKHLALEIVEAENQKEAVEKATKTLPFNILQLVVRKIERSKNDCSC